MSFVAQSPSISRGLSRRSNESFFANERTPFSHVLTLGAPDNEGFGWTARRGLDDYCALSRRDVPENLGVANRTIQLVVREVRS